MIIFKDVWLKQERFYICVGDEIMQEKNFITNILAGGGEKKQNAQEIHKMWGSS